MKKALLALAMMLTALLVSAQTEKGRTMIGATTDVAGTNVLSLICGAPNTVVFAFSSSKMKADEYEGEAENTTAFSLGPKIGYFVTDNFLIGINLKYSYFKVGEESDAFNYFEGGPNLRYYFTPNKIKPFLSGQGSFGTMTSGEVKTNVIAAQAGGGVAFFLSDKVSLDMLAGYTYLWSKDPKDNENNVRTVENGFGIGFGFSIFL